MNKVSVEVPSICFCQNCQPVDFKRGIGRYTAWQTIVSYWQKPMEFIFTIF